MTRAVTALLAALILKVVVCQPCNQCNALAASGCQFPGLPNLPQNGLPGCGCCGRSCGRNCGFNFPHSDICVDTCSPACTMSTQSFTLPRCCGCPPCCSSTPVSQTICKTRPVYTQQNFYTTDPKDRKSKEFPPRPMPPGNLACPPVFEYYPPYQCLPPPAPVAPSYCVQSVIVGGKSDRGKEDEKDSDAKKVVGRPGAGDAGGEGVKARGPESGVYLDQIGEVGRDAGQITGSAHDPHQGDSQANRNVGRSLRGTGEEDNTKRYENYLEKMLDVIKDKLEPECVGPSPMVVMQGSCGCSPRIRVRRYRRRKQRRYVLEDSEDPDMVVEEEEEDRAPCLLACCRSTRPGYCC